MYVTQSESSKPQIDYQTWARQEKEYEEAEDLARLQQKYLKNASDEKQGSTKENLTIFYEKVFESYTSALQINPAVPDTLQSVLRRDLLTFDRTAARSLAEAADSDAYMIKKFSKGFFHSSERLSNTLLSADRSFGDFIVLSSRAGYVGNLFVSERADNSCMRCESLHGQVFSLDELAEKSIIPPLHPNCKCKLFAMDAAALAVYNKNRNGFIRQLDLYCDGENLDEGGVYLLAHDTLGGISLRTQMEFPLATITDSENSAPKWYEGIKVWAEKFWTDFSAAADAFFERGESLVANADETMEENPLLGMALWADALSFGTWT